MNRRFSTGVLLAALAAVSGRAWQGTGKPDAGKTEVQEAKVSGLAFRLQKCHHETSTVTCDFTLTSLQGDTDLNFYSKTFVARSASRMITYESAEFPADLIQLAGKDMSSSTRATLVSGVVVNGQVFFYNVAQRPTKISLLSLRGRRTSDKGAGGIVFEAQFRNVALQ